MELSAEVFEPGVVTRDTDHAHTWFGIGELDGSVSPRIKEVAQILGAVGTVEISTNIWGAKWSKLLMNSMTSGMSAALGVKGGILVQDPEIFKILIELGKESAQVATALGYRLEPLLGLRKEDMSGSVEEFLEKSVLTLISKIDKGKGSKSMILADHMKGRLSEIDYTSGLVVRKGIEAKVPTPWNAAVLFVNKQIEQGILKPSMSNLEILKKSWKEP
jgi:2-dehydropantoate 2-reductase